MPKALTDAMVYLEITGTGLLSDATERLGLDPAFSEGWTEDGEPCFP